MWLKVERVVYEHGRYQVLKARKMTADRSGVSRDAPTITVTGDGLKAIPGSFLRVVGRYEEHKKFGRQFAVSEHLLQKDTTPEGAIKYLQKRVFGLSKQQIKMIVAGYGAGIYYLLDHDPEQLANIGGRVSEDVRESLCNYKAAANKEASIAYLTGYDLPEEYAEVAYEVFGGEASRIWRREPYRICIEAGVPYAVIERYAPKHIAHINGAGRTRAALYEAMKAYMANGHTLMPESLLRKNAETLISGASNAGELADKVLKQLLIERKMFRYGAYIQEGQAAQVEASIAKIITDRLKAKVSPDNKKGIGRELSLYEQRVRFLLSEDQEVAVKMALSNPLSVITGGPGTGKTTVIDAILSICEKSHPKHQITLLAPTGKAARRMMESTGRQASTIHSALNIGVDGTAEKTMCLPQGIVVIDEASMIDVEIAEKLLRVIHPKSRVVFVGDADQLMPIGSGVFLQDLLKSGVVPTKHLSTGKRQKNNSMIVLNAAKIQAIDKSIGEWELAIASDFEFIEVGDDEQLAVNEVLKAFNAALATTESERIMVLTPYRRGTSPLSVVSLNKTLQKQYLERITGGDSSRMPRYMRVGDDKFCVGDPVMQCQNQRAVANGDVGTITKVTGEELVVDYSGERTVSYTRDTLDALELAYATTVHKSQGSEADVVIFVVLPQHEKMLSRSLLYTGITRAKKRVVMVGSKGSVERAARNNQNIQRYTMLAAWLKQFSRGKQK